MKLMRLALLAFLSFFAASISSVASASPAAVTEDGQTIDISGGGKLYYHITGGGSGVPLVILNGGPGFDHRHMHIGTAFDLLGKDRRIIFYDQRGNGRSGPLKPGQSCTLADQIEDLEALRIHLKLDKWDVLGHSWGGFLSMAYSARHPEHVERLIIVDSAAPKFSDTIFLFGQVFPETIERRSAYTFADELGDKAASDASIREYLTMLFYSTEKRDNFIAGIHSDAFTKEVGAAVQRDIARFDLNPELPKFKFPTLVVTGRYDINVAPLIAYKIHKAIPGSKFAVFERSGHIPFYEQPDEFVAVIEPFLK